ncbi:MAG: hypothetical protein ACI9XU_001123 [Arenicella sp.]
MIFDDQHTTIDILYFATIFKRTLTICTAGICAQRIHQYLMSALAYALKKLPCQLGLFDYKTFPFVPLASL